MSAQSMNLDPNLSLTELFQTWPQLIPVFLRHQMSCVGCSMTPFDTVKDAAYNYGLKVDDFLIELKETISKT